MSDFYVSNSSPAVPPDEPSAATPETGKTPPTGDKTFSTVSQLQEEAPEAWYGQLMLMAQDMCNKAKRATDRAIKESKKSRNQ